MSELTNRDRENLIERISGVSARLTEIKDHPGRDELKAELRHLAWLLWLNGDPGP